MLASFIPERFCVAVPSFFEVDCAPHIFFLFSLRPIQHFRMVYDVSLSFAVVVKRAFVLVPPLAAALFSLPGWLLFVRFHDFCVVGRDDALNVFGAAV